jgi:hypothetical protein
MKTCKTEGCGAKHAARGYCFKHYYKAVAAGETWPAVSHLEECTFPACSKPHVAHGFCGMHYQRNKYNGAPDVTRSARKFDPVCSVATCDKPHFSKGFCSGHYYRWKKHGTPLPEVPLGTSNQSAHNKLPPQEAAKRRVLRVYVSDALRRGYTFNLDDDFFFRLVFAPCNYCGQLPSTEMKNKGMNGTVLYNGIDRVNNLRGYEPDNVVSCCSVCNRAKSSMPADEWFAWINRLIAHQRPV